MALQMYKVCHRAHEKHMKLKKFEAESLREKEISSPYYKKWRE